MTVVNGPEGDVSDWRAIDRRRAEDDVRRLWQRIFAATQAEELLLPARPWGLLEPGAVNSRTPGSEGGRAQ